MYRVKQFEEPRVEVMHALMREYPLATLVTYGRGGMNANPIPLLLAQEPGPYGVLRGHVARANPLWQSFDPSVETLAVFHGPDAYVSPNWYPSKRENGRVAPTWNYACVHAYGTLQVIDDRDWLRALLSDLSDVHEASSPEPWQLTDAPADYLDKLLGAVVGVEIGLSRLEGKWKMSQNQPAANQAGVVGGLTALGSEEALTVAQLVRECGA